MEDVWEIVLEYLVILEFFFQVWLKLKICLTPLSEAYLTCGVTTLEKSLSYPHLIGVSCYFCSFVGVFASCTSLPAYRCGRLGPAHFDFNAVIVSERHRQGQWTSELSFPPPHFIARDFCFLSRHAYMWVGMPIKMWIMRLKLTKGL